MPVFSRICVSPVEAVTKAIPDPDVGGGPVDGGIVMVRPGNTNQELYILRRGSIERNGNGEGLILRRRLCHLGGEPDGTVVGGNGDGVGSRRTRNRPTRRQSLIRECEFDVLVGFGDCIGKNGEIQRDHADGVDRNARERRGDGIILGVRGSQVVVFCDGRVGVDDEVE